MITVALAPKRLELLHEWAILPGRSKLRPGIFLECESREPMEIAKSDTLFASGFRADAAKWKESDAPFRVTGRVGLCDFCNAPVLLGRPQWRTNFLVRCNEFTTASGDVS